MEQGLDAEHAGKAYPLASPHGAVETRVTPTADRTDPLCEIESIRHSVGI